MNIQDISIKDFTYHLPDELIARYPLPQRDISRLLIYKSGNISEDVYRNIGTHLPNNSLIVFNNTKVVEARLLFKKHSGAVIEIFCLEPDDRYPDITTGMQQTKTVFWKCMIGGASKWKHGQVLEKSIVSSGESILLTAEIHARQVDSFVIKLTWEPAHLSFAELLHKAGAIPLPPYLKREAEEADNQTYQTIYAKQDGSVAAPTAGLHFTEAIFDDFAKRKITTEFVTLHVGAGTFKPVKASTIGGHEMHSEFIEVDHQFLNSLIQAENVIAVGTTSLRTLESLYWLGIKCQIGEIGEGLTQWEAYELPQQISAEEALTSLKQWMLKNNLQKLITKTQLLIAPGYRVRIADILVTNFHQPGSTLLLLVAAAAGNDWKKIYDYALKNNFRFLSYGDGCLIYI